ncbi:MAG: phosphatidate cytidylyltransferase [Polaromonas sp.]|nr:phosphatidate cytidylyltransferase [Polaromonas sp.]
MLKLRIITAIVLLAILLPALFYSSPTPFCAMALLLIAAAGWEWGRLNACDQGESVLLGLILAAMCGCAWYLGLLDKPMPALWILGGSAWVLVGSLLLRLGVVGWSGVAKSLRLVGGIAALWLAWLAVAQARVIGINFLLSVLLLVWAADIFAYAAGRALANRFTKSKLAPAISPGKSWEGVWGGMTGVILLSVTWAWLDRSGFSALGGSLYARLWAQHGVLVMLLGVIFLCAMSVVGDLVESLVKRSAGAKDSSGLLPGHGGVLDRVDALLPAVPLALMLVSL